MTPGRPQGGSESEAQGRHGRDGQAAAVEGQGTAGEQGLGRGLGGCRMYGGLPQVVVTSEDSLLEA